MKSQMDLEVRGPGGPGGPKPPGEPGRLPPWSRGSITMVYLPGGPGYLGAPGGHGVLHQGNLGNHHLGNLVATTRKTM